MDAGIVPMVTIYQSDLPMNFYSNGGWANDSMIEHFERYATTLFREFGDRVSENDEFVVKIKFSKKVPSTVNKVLKNGRNIRRRLRRNFQIIQHVYYIINRYYFKCILEGK